MTALYDAELVHTRTEVLARRFSHRVYLWLVDVDDLPVLPRWLRPFARFDALAPVRGWLAERGITATGRVLALTNARVLGYVFNPLTVYWVHDASGAVECVVAEVHNTYGEAHRYLLRPDERGRARTGKEFYVSPFLDGGGEYLMRVPSPSDTLSLTITLRQGGRIPFTATLTGTRRPATTKEVVKTVLRLPFMPQRVTALIRAHGIALWAKGIRIRPRGVAR